MSETFECGDSGALVAYLYEECEPAMRQEIAGHLTQCESCSNEIDGLGWTRQSLEVWTPPMSALGFQLPVIAQGSRLPWWRAPLPAWAQAVAALLIFGVGLSVGLTRGPAASPQAATQPAVVTSADTALRAELSQLEQRLKSEMAAIRTTASTPVPQTAARSDAPSDDILKKVEEIVAQSEERQRREFTLRNVELARDFEAQRRIDMASVRETVGQFQGVTGTEIRQQREAIESLNNFIRISQQGR
jgi:hypothetical protein